VTILPVIPVFNQQAKDRPPPLPIKVDGLLMHIPFALGSVAAEELGAIIDGMIDTGAGCCIGNLDFFLSLATLHPSIVMQVHESRNGEYSPIMMTGIVEDGAGAVSTNLPVAFQLRTPYRMPDGTNMCIIVGLGKHVAVNFILSMGFLKSVKAVIDCHVGQVGIPLYQEPHKRFPCHYQLPKRYQAPLAVTERPNLSFFRTNQRAAWEQLPASEGVVAAILAHIPDSKWLGPAKEVATELRALAAVPIPPAIRGQGQGQQSAERRNSGVPGVDTWTAGSSSSPVPVGAQRKKVRFPAEGGGNSIGAGISGAGDSSFANPVGRGAHGHAALPGPNEDSDGGLFTSSGSEQ